MKSLQELYDLRFGGGLRDRVSAALVLVAMGILQEDASTPNHAQRLAWVKAAVADVGGMLDKMLWGFVVSELVKEKGIDVSDEELIAIAKALVEPAIVAIRLE